MGVKLNRNYGKLERNYINVGKKKIFYREYSFIQGIGVKLLNII